MNNMMFTILGIMIPFFGTCLGSFFVFFLKNNMNKNFQKIMTGFAVGVMIAASIWSLIIPSTEMAFSQGIIEYLPATIGLLLGVIFLIIVNKMAEKLENKENGKSLNMLLFSVTLHNIPEGMAVGVCFAGLLSGNSGISLLSAMILAIGIGIQNIPEGAIISMPMKVSGEKKNKAFIYGVLSGIVEPISAFLTLALTNIVVPILPYLLSFAAGAMIYVVVEELIPEIHKEKKSCLGIISITIGFIVMMVLDITLG